MIIELFDTYILNAFKINQMKNKLGLFLWITLLSVIIGCNASNTVERPEEGYDPEGRLQVLNIELPEPPSPVANYVNGDRDQ